MFTQDVRFGFTEYQLQCTTKFDPSRTVITKMYSGFEKYPINREDFFHMMMDTMSLNPATVHSGIKPEILDVDNLPAQRILFMNLKEEKELTNMQ